MDSNNRYLIPANSKKSKLILGFFTQVDLVIFLMGVLFSIAMLITIQSNNILIMLLVVTPALISTFLILPVPYYHNILQLLTNIKDFFTKNKKYYWKGWCVSDDESNR